MSTQKTPTVSVIIPVCNRPTTVRRAIETVLAQTYQDFEIIVVDDGSTDQTPSAIAAVGDARVKIIRHERNRGGSAARNTGIRASSAPYVAFLDSDDEWFPRKLERQLEVFRQSGDRLGLVYSGAERIMADASVAIDMPRHRDDLCSRLLLADNVIGGASVAMVRRDVFDEIAGFDEALPAAQDVDLWLRICERFPADSVSQVLVRIWQPAGGDRISANVAAKIRARELFCQKHREKLLQRGILHVWLRESGWVHLRYARDHRKARELYLNSIREQPLALVTYVLLFTSCLPMSWLDRLAQSIHLLTASVGQVRATWLSKARSHCPAHAESPSGASRDSAA